MSVVLTPTIYDKWKKLPQIQSYSQHYYGLEDFHVPTVPQNMYQHKNPLPFLGWIGHQTLVLSILEILKYYLHVSIMRWIGVIIKLGTLIKKRKDLVLRLMPYTTSSLLQENMSWANLYYPQDHSNMYQEVHKPWWLFENYYNDQYMWLPRIFGSIKFDKTEFYHYPMS